MCNQFVQLCFTYTLFYDIIVDNKAASGVCVCVCITLEVQLLLQTTKQQELATVFIVIISLNLTAGKMLHN